MSHSKEYISILYDALVRKVLNDSTQTAFLQMAQGLLRPLSHLLCDQETVTALDATSGRKEVMGHLLWPLPFLCSLIPCGCLPLARPTITVNKSMHG